MATTTEAAPRTSARVHVQKFGTFLSNMIMPNIGAIIAWGLLTAFVIPDGWTPNEKIATVVGPSIFYLLPILIAYTGGKLVYGVRGGVVGAVGVMGVIMATSDPLFLGPEGNAAPMFLGAMIMGPLTAWTMKKIDSIWDGKIRPGFEMLVDNFSAGIWAAVMSVIGMFALAPVLREVIAWLGSAVQFLVDNSLLPLSSLLIEPAKVLFLNNAINHGVLTPLGIQQSTEQGYSILFLLEANPGPGFGLLLAYCFFGKGIARASAPGALIIHFFGGIHEIYFPYVLAKPRLILAMILGGMTGITINMLFDTGLRAPAAPGSFLAVLAQIPGGMYFGVIASVFGGAAVSFLVASFLLKLDRSDDEVDLAAATAEMEEMKGKSSLASSVLAGGGGPHTGPIGKIVFACDAGMGSSAMGASVLRRKVQEAGFDDVTVVNRAIQNLDDEWDLVVVHRDLAERARMRTPSAAHVTVDNFMNSPRYDEVVEVLRKTNGPGGEAVTEAADTSSADLLPEESVVLRGRATTRDEAITEAGQLLVATGAVDASYVDSMHEREQSVSTHMGNGLAIPHGTNEAKPLIRRTALSFVRYPDGIDWNGNPVKFVVGIAGAGDDHLTVLSRLGQVFTDQERVDQLESAQSVADVRRILGQVGSPSATAGS
jgi:PTS system mannitol-specific IIC component